MQLRMCCHGTPFLVSATVKTSRKCQPDCMFRTRYDSSMTMALDAGRRHGSELGYSTNRNYQLRRLRDWPACFVYTVCRHNKPFNSERDIVLECNTSYCLIPQRE